MSWGDRLPLLPEPLQIDAVDVHVLVAVAPDDPQALGHALDALSDEERAEASRFRRRADAASSAAGRALLRLFLGRLLDRSPRELVFDRWCPRCRSTHGKPRLLDRPAQLDFSLSRAQGHLILAVARLPVGVDVERKDREVGLELVSFALAGDERTELAALAPEQRAAAFLACWTRKEAVLKAIGHGFAVDPTALSVTFVDGVDPRIRALPREFGSPYAWALFPLRGADWAGAVAVKGRPRLHIWDARHLLDDAR